jgi:Flp pilus assembly pilin Flp
MKLWAAIRFRRRFGPRAVTSLEYGLIAGVIVVSILVGFQHLAGHLREKFSGIGVTVLNTPTSLGGGGIGHGDGDLIYAARRADSAAGNWAIAWSIKAAPASGLRPSAIT